MVYSEATVALPLIAGYAYHKRGWEKRPQKRFADLFVPAGEVV
jgi:deoxyhypusine synthase